MVIYGDCMVYVVHMVFLGLAVIAHAYNFIRRSTYLSLLFCDILQVGLRASDRAILAIQRAIEQAIERSSEYERASARAIE